MSKETRDHPSLKSSSHLASVEKGVVSENGQESEIHKSCFHNTLGP
jgi:hypothetical protein